MGFIVGFESVGKLFDKSPQPLNKKNITTLSQKVLKVGFPFCLFIAFYFDDFGGRNTNHIQEKKV